MKFYFAPMEGITGYIYRNTFEQYFGGIEKYFAPFIAPDRNCYLNRKEKRDVLPENNAVRLVPQVLTNKADYFIGSMKALSKLGYQEVNLNLGCPAATVVTKKKGAGMLRDTEYLDAFLYEVFEEKVVEISVKTRLGMESADEFYELLEILNQYPICELIIHPRVREDYYNGSPDLDMYEYAVKNSKNKVVYNGEIHSADDYYKFVSRFPETDTIMLGRGLLKNPFLINEIMGNDVGDGREQIRKFMEKIKNDYYEVMQDERNVLFKLKELWLYLSSDFEYGDKYWKKIKKAKNFREYESIMKGIFETE